MASESYKKWSVDWCLKNPDVITRVNQLHDEGYNQHQIADITNISRFHIQTIMRLRKRDDEIYQ